MPIDVDPTPVSGVWFRHVPATADPLFRPERPGDGRWQRGAVVEGFYLADSEQTAWAEWYRALAELGLPPLRQLPRDLWQFQIDVTRVADLSSPGALLRVGLERPRPDRDSWPAFQTVGEMLYAEGYAGVLYAAAARPCALALCLFRGSDAFGVRLPPPARHHEPPPPPRGLHA